MAEATMSGPNLHAERDRGLDQAINFGLIGGGATNTVHELAEQLRG
jgi:hypothetical protein